METTRERERQRERERASGSRYNCSKSSIKPITGQKDPALTHLLNIETLKWILASGVLKISIRRGVLLRRIELRPADLADTDMTDMNHKIILTIQVTNNLNFF